MIMSDMSWAKLYLLSCVPLQAVMLYLQASELGMEVAQSNAAWMLDRGFTHAGESG